jgi:hypothetical protein
VSTLTCSCKTLADLYGATGLALRGLYERGAERHADPQCPMHGDSPEAKAARRAWLDDMAVEGRAATLASPAYLLLQLTTALEGWRFNYDNEAELQEGIAQALDEAGVRFRRERQLGRDRIDFYIPFPSTDTTRAVLRHALPFRGPDPEERGIGVEVKAQGSVAAVQRQLHRYAQRPEVTELVLLTTKRRHGQVAREMMGKRVHVILLAEETL